MMALPTLLTGRLRLRAWTAEDGAAFHGLWGDPRVIWWGHAATSEASVRKLEEILARCAAMPEGMGWWAVEAREAENVVENIVGNILGNVVLQPAPYDGTAELGYHLAHAAWGRGYATEATRAVISHGFSALALPAVSAVVAVDNHASHRVAARLGLGATGPITHNGMPHIRYELARKGALSSARAESEEA